MAVVDLDGVTLPSGDDVRPGREDRPGRARTVTLARGVRVPYPEPGSEAATNVGKANRRVDTKAEVRLRSAVHRRGLRFRKDQLVFAGGLRVRPDLVFTRWRVAVFVDGCYWHRCPDHSSPPRRNLDYWLPKFQANIDRDARVDAALAGGGWLVMRIWEHDEVAAAVDRIASAVEGRRGQRQT